MDTYAGGLPLSTPGAIQSAGLVSNGALCFDISYALQ
jgi:hypothetical protein